MQLKKWVVGAIVVCVIVAAHFFDGPHHSALEFLQRLYRDEPSLAFWIYFAVYVLLVPIPLPTVAFLLTLGAGALFGVWQGLVLASFASAIGGTLGFLLSRYLFRDWVHKKYGRQLRPIDQGLKKDGGFYLLSLRLIPFLPFTVINVLMGLTPMRVGLFYLITQLGMLPSGFVVANAGAELGSLRGVGVADVFSLDLILAFVLLGLFPLLARAIVDRLKKYRLYRPYRHSKPSRFDTNLVVIGGGSAGLVSAYIAATVKAKVTLIEKHKMGGDCLNTGCVPSKALIRAARSVRDIERAAELGIEVDRPRINFAKVMLRVRSVVKVIEPHDSVERYTALGVDCEQGEARIVSPWQVSVNGRTISSRNIVIASGARPVVPPIPGLDQLDYLTSDNLWDLTELPSRLLVMGGGPIGCELAQAFNQLGSQVTLVDMMPRILPREDEDVSEFMRRALEAEGVKILTAHKSIAFEQREGENLAVLEAAGEQKKLAFDRVLVAVGRRANTEGLGLEELGIGLNPNGTISVDEYLRTRLPNIVACGDVAGPYQFTHTASHQAWYAAVNSLFGTIKKFRVDYSVIPWVTFTEPEVAHVGLSEADAKAENIAYELTKFGINELDRAIADKAASGFVKVITPPGSDKILGATIVGARAGDMLTEFVTAMKRNLGLNKILGTIHAYPTMSEANKFVAGEWKRNHAPEKLLQWAQKYHAWNRR